MNRLGVGAVALALVGCNVVEAEELGEHACEHVDEAGTSLDAAPSIDEAGDALVEISGEPYSVGLDAGTPGFVRIEVLEDTPAVLFVGAAGVIQELLLWDVPVPLPEPAADGFCGDVIPEHFHLSLYPGFWHLRLESPDAGSVWLMLAPAGAHVHTD
jgi:hypothetical protein